MKKDHPDSNYKWAWDGLLSKVPIPSQQVHAINDTLSTEAAAEDYEVCIKQLTKHGMVVEAATGSAEAPEALVEEKAGEVAGKVEPETPATLVDKAAPMVEEKEVPTALEEVTAPLAEEEAASLADALDHVEEGVAPASSLGFDALVTEQ